MNQRMERPTERVSPTGPRVLVLAGVLLSISLTDASWTYRCADHVTPGGGRMRQGRRQTILPARSPLSGFSSDSVTMHVPYLVSTASPSFGRSGNSRSWMSFQLTPSMVTVNFFMRRSSHACVRRAHCGDKERQPTTKENRVRPSAPPTHPAGGLCDRRRHPPEQAALAPPHRRGSRAHRRAFHRPNGVAIEAEGEGFEPRSA